MKILPVLLFLAVSMGCSFGEYSRPVTEDEAQEALSTAQEKEGFPYVWGGNGPVEFDCSGLIVYSYQQALGRRYIFTDGPSLFDDAAMDTIYRHYARIIPLEQTVPGDIIFITSEEDRITHGALLISHDGESVTFINAVDRKDIKEVVTDTWQVSSEVRGQWIEGFGRLLVSSQ